MNVNSIARNAYQNTITSYSNDSMTEKKANSSKSATSTLDTLEISSETYALQSGSEKMTATSGKDTLGITRGSKDNTFVIHFTDSAMVSRTISRGYLTVNGTRIALTDEVKDQLTQMDKQAQTDREKSYNSYILQHDLAVAQQQGSVYTRVTEDIAKAFEIAARIASGGKVPISDEKKLMELNPQMYAMAKISAAMAKHHKKYDSVYKDENPSGEGASKEDSIDGVEWKSFEWTSYETQMSISMEGTPEIQGISKGAIDM